MNIIIMTKEYKYGKDFNLELIDIDNIEKIPDDYPDEFKTFCKNNGVKLPGKNSGRGKALRTMVNNPGKYFDRETCDKFCKKFDIETGDSIQLFNKFQQIGLRTQSDNGDKGKLYIQHPYHLTDKHGMRKDFDKNIDRDKYFD